MDEGKEEKQKYEQESDLKKDEREMRLGGGVRLELNDG